MTESLYEIPVNDEFIHQVLDNPEKFIVPDENLEKKILGITKKLFDYGIKNENNSSCPLEELYIDGFDNEQIWEEIQLQNVPLIEHFNEISNDIIENDLQMSEDEEEINEVENNELNEDEDEEFDNLENLNEEKEEEEEDNEKLEEHNEDNEEEMEDEEFNEDIDNSGKSSNTKRKFKKTVVDDDFFSLREMEAFAEEFERKDILRSRRFNGENEDEENDEGMADEDYEYMNFDQDFDDDDDDMEIRYEDFFAPPEEYEKNKNKGKNADKDNINNDEDKMDDDNDDDEHNMEDDEDDEDEDDEDEEKEVEHELDEDGFPNLHENEEDEEDEEEEDDGENNSDNDDEDEDDEGQNLTTKISNLFSEDNEEEEGEELSTFEKSQKKMQETIEKLEEEAIADKHWALKGEISSKARPLNSLLEEDLEVEHASKPVPVITEEVTQTLEDMIRQRILDNLFDDVERKIDINTLKPKYDPNKQFELFEEQKKQSLSEVYENEYLRQTAGEHQSEKELELEKRHQEIDELFKKLCQNLDALSNWHYAPKPAKMEMTVVSNVPTIEMEEVLPIHESENTLLAPEETYEKPKTDVKGETEIDSSEKKRQRARRRKIKKVERKQKEREQKLRAKLLPNSISQKHANKKQALETLTGNKNVTIISNSSLNVSGGKKKKGNGAKVISTTGGKATSNESRQTSLKL